VQLDPDLAPDSVNGLYQKGLYVHNQSLASLREDFKVSAHLLVTMDLFQRTDYVLWKYK